MSFLSATSDVSQSTSIDSFSSFVNSHSVKRSRSSSPTQHEMEKPIIIPSAHQDDDGINQENGIDADGDSHHNHNNHKYNHDHNHDHNHNHSRSSRSQSRSQSPSHSRTRRSRSRDRDRNRDRDYRDRKRRKNEEEVKEGEEIQGEAEEGELVDQSQDATIAGTTDQAKTEATRETEHRDGERNERGGRERDGKRERERKERDDDARRDRHINDVRDREWHRDRDRDRNQGRERKESYPDHSAPAASRPHVFSSAPFNPHSAPSSHLPSASNASAPPFRSSRPSTTRPPRSSTRLYIKCLPATITTASLTKLFLPFGALIETFVLRPGGMKGETARTSSNFSSTPSSTTAACSAFVEYMDPKSAQTAFSRFHHQTIAIENENCVLEIDWAVPLPPDSKHRDRLLVSNLPYHIKSDEIAARFSVFGRILDVSLSSGESPDSSAAFIQYADAQAAQAAQFSLNGRDWLVTGQILAVNFARKKRGVDPMAAGTTNKAIVEAAQGYGEGAKGKYRAAPPPPPPVALYTPYGPPPPPPFPYSPNSTVPSPYHYPPPPPPPPPHYNPGVPLPPHLAAAAAAYAAAGYPTSYPFPTAPRSDYPPPPSTQQQRPPPPPQQAWPAPTSAAPSSSSSSLSTMPAASPNSLSNSSSSSSNSTTNSTPSSSNSSASELSTLASSHSVSSLPPLPPPHPLPIALPVPVESAYIAAASPYHQSMSTANGHDLRDDDYYRTRDRDRAHDRYRARSPGRERDRERDRDRDRDRDHRDEYRDRDRDRDRYRDSDREREWDRDYRDRRDDRHRGASGSDRR